MTEAPPPPPGGDRPSDQPASPPPSYGQPPSGGGYGPPPTGGGYGQPPTGGGYGPPPTGGGYGQPPTGGGYGQPGYAGQAPVHGVYAEWPSRVISALLDYFAPFVVAGVLYEVSRPIGFIAWLAAIAWAIYQSYQGGQTGQSLGKQIAHIRLIGETTGQPIGGGLGIGRYFLHIIDGLPCYLGYLWPLWDPKKQTFADKIVHTVVVKV